MKNKQRNPKSIVSAICDKHHFTNPNTTEIIFSLLFIGLVTRLLTVLSREGKY